MTRAPKAPLDADPASAEERGRVTTLRFDRSVAFWERLGSRGVNLNNAASHVAGPVILEPPLELSGGLDGNAGVEIGAFTYSWSKITGSVTSIGRYCSIAREVIFGALEHPVDWLSTSSFTYQSDWMWGRFAEEHGREHEAIQRTPEELTPPIRIGNDVWIGVGAYIRGGVVLGDGCIIGAKAVVTRDVPPYAVVVGNPGRIAKYRFDPELIAELLASRWWDYAFPAFSGPSLRDRAPP